jgi:hypothetical protein
VDISYVFLKERINPVFCLLWTRLDSTRDSRARTERSELTPDDNFDDLSSPTVFLKERINPVFCLLWTRLDSTRDSRARTERAELTPDDNFDDLSSPTVTTSRVGRQSQK